MKYKSPTYVVEVSKADPVYKDFIATCRALLRRSGVRLRLSGRHPNRKKFYENTRLNRQYRQNFPINLATSIYINLQPAAAIKPSSWEKDYINYRTTFDKQMKAVRPILQNLVQMYKNNGTNIFIERS